VNNELENTCKESVAAYFKLLQHSRITVAEQNYDKLDIGRSVISLTPKLEEITVNLSTLICNRSMRGLYIKQTPWPLVRERTIPTELPPLVDEI
jgi:hypothetical protein